MSAELAGLVDTEAQRAARRRSGVVIGARADGEQAVRAAGSLQVDAVTEIGSITKVFTGLLLAEAVVRGEVALQTPVRDLLPAETQVPERDGVLITLEHLATHRSGLPRSPVGISPWTATRRMRRGLNPYGGFEPEDLLAGLAHTRLRRTPGTGKPAYSNAGFGLLGAALAHAAGTSYDELVTERICTPLGLTDTVTAVTAAAEHRARWAIGHRRRRAVQDWTLTGVAGAGALRSTAADMLTFLQHQIEPSGSPLEEAIRLSRQPRFLRRGSGVGLGWQLLEDGDVVWHNGGTGGFRAIVLARPARGHAVVALTNSARMLDLVAFGLLRRLGD